MFRNKVVPVVGVPITDSVPRERVLNLVNRKTRSKIEDI